MSPSDDATTGHPEQPEHPEHPEHAEQPEVEPAPLLTLADGLPAVTDTPAALAAVCEAIAAGEGPVAIDAERASGYRYSGRAYLVQLRRRGSGTALVDPTAFDDLAPLQEAIGDAEWVLHAATQDLPCLKEEGLVPAALFDTELAGRLLGYPRVGLGTLVETVLGFRMKKEHSAADWSTRPLPEPWLEYAALDVEVLVELRDALAAELEERGRAEWARQEFDHLRGFEPPVRVEPWRRTSGVHRVRGRRALAAVRELWETRDEIARRRDVSPGRLVPDSALVAAATAMPTTRDALLATKGFHGRAADRYSARWMAALRRAADLPEDELPARSPRSDGPPVPRAWAERDPVAAVRLKLAREHVAALADHHGLPAENLLAPDSLRRVLWSPPRVREPGALLDAVVDQLRGLGARGWQVALVAPILVDAVLDADRQAAGLDEHALRVLAGARRPRGPQEPSDGESPGSSDSSGGDGT